MSSVTNVFDAAPMFKSLDSIGSRSAKPFSMIMEQIHPSHTS